MDTIRQSQPQSPLLNYDIVIVGGGMVGMTLALALAKQTRLSIAILEAREEVAPFKEDDYHHRVSAIALASVSILESLSVWEKIRSQRVSPFNTIQVWDGESRENLRFECNEIGEPLLGYIIENNVIQNALREELKHYPAVNFLSPVKLQDLRFGEESITLIAADETQYQARLAVAADGAHSWLRDEMHIRVRTEDYDQQAIVASVVTELPHEKVARQVFLPSGPLAFLPLKEAHTSSIVWSLPSEEAKRLQAMEEEDFKAALTTAFASRLGRVKSIGRRFTFPLKKQDAAKYIGKRIALVGDAAHVMHPLAGQGVNLGLLDAVSLAEVIADAEHARRDFAATTTLRRYERWRRADNLALLTGVDLIKQFFASDRAAIKTVRGLGIALTSRLAVLKNIFTRYAVGRRSGLPALASPDQSG